MACSYNIRSKFLPTATGGGIWELVGYSTNPTGPFGAGGNFPWTSIANDNPLVSFDNIEQGYYQLIYSVADPCGGAETIIIPVLGQGDAGISKSLTYCTSAAVLNVASELGTVFENGSLEATVSWSGNGLSTGAGAITGFSGNNPYTATIDVALLPTGAHNFTLTITPKVLAGYANDSCCLVTTANLLVVKNTSTINIALNNCEISINQTSGCSGATFTLYKSSTIGGPYTSTGVTSFPATVNTNSFYKVISSNCSCPAESNIVQTTACCVLGSIGITIDPQYPCVLYKNAESGTCSGIYSWQKSCNNGVTWAAYPEGGNYTYLVVNDNCCYRLIKTCTDGNVNCLSISNTICATSCTGCLGFMNRTVSGCTYTVSGGTTCTGGIVSFQELLGGSWFTLSTYTFGTYPHTFNVPHNGTFRAILNCGDGCPSIVAASHTYTTCGGASCSSVLSTSISNCVITATVTNCPSPTYTFRRPDGLIAYNGPNNTYDTSNSIDGMWTVTADGCPNCSTLTSNISVQNCEPLACNCAPTITMGSCGVLSVSLSNCTGYTIAWVYRVDVNAAWTVVQSGGNNYTGSINGQYAVRMTKSGCPLVYSNIISVTCFVGCSCTNAIALSGCTINITQCSGYTNALQILSGGSWVTVATNVSSYTPTTNGTYRLQSSKSGCSTVISNNLSVSCVASCNLVITSFVNAGTCGHVSFSWSGGLGTISASFQYALTNSGNCATAAGWSNFTPASVSLNQGAKTGTAIITSPTVCGKCIRLVLTDSNTSCSPDEEKLLVPCCCTDSPTISSASITDLYDINIYDSSNVVNKLNAIIEANSRYPRVSGNYKVAKNSVVFQTTAINELLEDKIHAQYKNTTNLTNGDYCVSVRLYRSDTNAIVTVPLAPGTALLSGSSGTVVSGDLIFNSASPTVLSNALDIVIGNYLNSLSLDYLSRPVTVSSSGLVLIGFYMKHNPTGPFTGLNTLDKLFIYNVASTNINGTDIDIQITRVPITKSYVSPCGTINRVLIENPSDRIFSFTSNYNNLVIGSANPLLQTYSGNNNSITCNSFLLSLGSVCGGATYLWSTGATTASITVSTGSYSVVITCPDGCQYTRSITV